MTHTVMCAEGHVCHGAPPGGMLQILAELSITTIDQENQVIKNSQSLLLFLLFVLKTRICQFMS